MLTIGFHELNKVKFLAKSEKYRDIEVRFVPEKYKSEVGFEICGDNVYIQTVKCVVKIKNKKLADSLKKYFDILWKVGKK